jgi:disulfide bond formation protein DsbB
MEARELLDEWRAELIFLIGSAATAGSLYTSTVLNWHVCGLCIAQRIAMYPVPVLAGYAILSERRELVRYALPLSVIGGFFAAWHLTSMVTDPTQSCGLVIPCSLPNRLFVGVSLMPRYLPASALAAFAGISFLASRCYRSTP